jgi:hypothetical protein
MGRSRVAANPVPGSSRSSRSWPASGTPGSRPAPSSSGQPFKQCFGSGSGSSRSWPASGTPGSRPAPSSSGQHKSSLSDPDPDPADPGQPVAFQAQDRRQAPQVSIKAVFRIRIRIQQILASQWHSRLKTGAKLLRPAI